MTVLLVEDDANDERLTLRFLRRDWPQIQVFVARTVDEAETFFSEEQSGVEEVDLVLLDQRLPGRDGLDLLRKLRQEPRFRLIPVVVMTGSHSSQIVADSHEAGANGCVLKPLDPRDYQEMVSCLASYWLGVNMSARSSRESHKSKALAL